MTSHSPDSLACEWLADWSSAAMNLRRILKVLFGSFLSQGVTVIWQVLIPPFFLRYFGLEVYGEWIALSASVNYLGTLNYGIQTYANNEMTIRYNRGDEVGARTIQASAFRLLIVLFLSFADGGPAGLSAYRSSRCSSCATRPPTWPHSRSTC